MSRMMTRQPPDRREGGEGAKLAWAGVAVFGASLLTTLIATAPITLLSLPAAAMPAGMQLTPVAGTLWHGRWQLTLPKNQPLRATADFLPFALLRLQPAWVVRVQGDGIQLQAEVAPGARDLRIARMQAQLSADSPLIRTLTPWPLGGAISAGGDARFERGTQGLILRAANLSAQWSAAQVTTTEPLSLGDLSLGAEVKNQQLSAILTPKSSADAPMLGELKLGSAWPIAAAPRVQGYVQPTSHASMALRQQLGLLGRRDESGKIRIQGVLPGF